MIQVQKFTAVTVERFSGQTRQPEGGLRLEEFTRHRATSAACRFDPFAKPYRNDRYLRIPAEDPRRFGSDSGHLVADPIGHQVRFSPLGVPVSLKSSEHRFLLVVGHLIKHAHVGAYRLLGLAPAAIENCNRRSDLCTPRRLWVRHSPLERIHCVQR